MAGLLDTIIQGILLGGLYALFAAGLSLIFGIMRLVNLAHGDLIVLAAFAILALGSGLGLDPLLATLLALPVMFLIGFGLQQVLLNRTLGHGLLPPLLVTFGLSIIIQNGLLQGFTADSQRLQAGAIETASINLGGGVAIGLIPLITFASAVIVIIGLNILFYNTALGRAFRATSDDLQTAELMGIDYHRTFALAMGIAMIVVTIAGLYLGMRANFDPTIGPARLLYAFEAVIIGGLGSFWGTLAGGIIIGLAQTIGANIDPEWQILAGHLAFLFVLVLRPRGLFPACWTELMAAVPASPSSTGYRVAVSTRTSPALAVAGLLLLVGLVALPSVAERDLIQDLSFVFYMLALAQCWNLLAGYAGLVSVGQQAFVGLGGYLLFALTIFANLDPLLAIVLAGVVAGLFAIPTGLVVFRFRGAYFAIGSWVVAEVYRLVFAQIKQLGGGTGTSLPPSVSNGVVGIDWVKTLFDVRTPAARDIITYWAALALAAGTLAMVYLLLRSRRGLALAAIRDQEATAESVGINTVRTKLAVYVLVAAVTGMIGALIYLQKARISPDSAFAVLDWTAYVILIVVIGGIGSIEGPVVGVIVFYLLQRYLADFGTWYLILLGAIAIAVMLFAPQGIWGSFNARFGLVLFPTGRRLERASSKDGE